MVYLRSILVILLFTLSGYTAHASHALGADLSYEYLSPNTYRVTYSLYRDCNGIAAPGTVTASIWSDLCGFSLSTVLNPDSNCVSISGYAHAEELPLTCDGLSTCQGGTLPGVQVYTYCGIIVLPGECSDWTVAVSVNARNASITNLQEPDLYDLFQYARINNSNGLINNSAIFLNYPTVLMEGNTPVIINHGTVEPDGDSLVYSLAQPLHDENNPIPYAPGYSLAQPLMTTGPFNFSTTTGQFSFNPVPGQSAVIDMLVQEYRNGVLVGETMRDLQYIFIAGGQPNQMPYILSPGITNVSGGTRVDSTTVRVRQDQTLTFQFKAHDPDNDSLIINFLSGVYSPAPLFSQNFQDTATVTITWTPDSNMIGTQVLYIVVKDSRCPVFAHNVYAVTVLVDEDIFAGDDRVYCLSSGPVQLQALGATSYSWSPSAGLSDSSIANPVATPAVTTAYVVTGMVPGFGLSSDTIVVMVNSNNVIARAGNDTTICEGMPVLLSGQGGDFYQWNPINSLDDASSAVTMARPSSTTLYTLVASDSSGCEGYDSVLITVNSINFGSIAHDETCLGHNGSISLNPSGGSAPYTVSWSTGDTTLAITALTPGAYTVTVTDALNCEKSKIFAIQPYFAGINLTPSQVSLCKGDTLQHNSGTAFFNSQCGLAGSSAPGFGITTTIGTGINFQPNSNDFPAIYGNFYEGARHQILYRATDLVAAGCTPGKIEELAFHIKQVVGASLYRKFTIKMGCTSDAVLNQWMTGLTDVYYSSSHTITTGWLSYNIDDYMWDGTSNIVVEVCFNNDMGGTTNNSISNSINYYTNTPYNSVISYAEDDMPDLCDVVNPTGLFNNTIDGKRPNIRMKISPLPSAAAYSALWSPTIGVSDSTAFEPLFFPDTTTTYTQLISDTNGCFFYDTVVVGVNDLHVDLGDDTLACGGNVMGLNPQVTTSGPSQTYSYVWQSPDASLAGTTTHNNYVTFTDSATVILTVTGGQVCSAADTLLINVDTTCYANISGYVKHDINSNCIFEPGDTALRNVLVSLNHQYYTFTDSTGAYTFRVDPGVYEIGHYPGVYANTFCPGGVITLSALQPDTAYTDNNFYDVLIPGANDLEVELFSTATTMNGQNLQIEYRNAGTATQDAQVVLFYSASATYTSATLAPYAHDLPSRMITWDFPSLIPGQTGIINVHFSTNQMPGIALYDSALIYPIQTDWTPANNIATVHDVTVGPYDPNNKLVSPEGEGMFGYIAVQDTTLSYIVNFQNVGNAPAVNVVIKDTLDADVDITTFRAGHSSHSYTLSVQDNNKLIFTFGNINLPDSITNEPASHGYVTYSVKQKDGLMPGTKIYNRAGIYFDSNPVVNTNRTENTIMQLQMDTGTVNAGASKTVTPDGNITLNDSILNYTINFSNTGTDTAETVVINDTLDADLDWGTLQVTGNSHSYTATNSGGFVTFTFTNVNLVDSATNPAASHGYISYSVKQNPALAIGTEIRNTAYVLIDTMAAVTNTTVNTITDPIGIGENEDAEDLVVYPNPAKDMIYIGFGNLQASSMEMTDQLGRIVAAVKPEQGKATISTAALPSGIYFVKAYTTKGIISRKVSVVH